MDNRLKELFAVMKEVIKDIEELKKTSNKNND
jgi:hypothetical protein